MSTSSSSIGDSAGRLSVDLTPFIGRRDELTHIRAALERSRLVTLTGPGGVGKTRLAVQTARNVQRAFEDGVRVIWLADIRDGGLIGHSVNAALGLFEHSAQWQLQTLVDHIADRHLLLVMDNCEHVVDAAAGLAGDLLSHCPRLQILATSRQALGVSGESVLSVPPLSTPSHDVTPRNEALRLFLDRAASALPSLTFSVEDEAKAAELCRLLDGIPLAIELAAVRLRALSLDELLQRMEDRYALLTRGSRTAPPRHQTLRAAIEGTDELCTQGERLLWQRLSVFSGGFTLDAAEAVASGDGVDVAVVLDLVDGLVDKSVLTASTESGGYRYQMLETLREYGAAALSEPEERRLHDRHRNWFVSLARRAEAEWSGPDQPEWLRRLHREHANLRAALQSAFQTEPTAGIDLVTGIENYWLAQGFLSEAREWLTRLLDRTPELTPARGRGLRLDAWLAILQGDLASVDQQLEEAAAVAAATDDEVLRTFVVQTQGLRGLFAGDLDSAIGHLHDAMADFDRLEHVTGRIHTLFELGLSHGLVGDTAVSAQWHSRCQALANAVGESWWLSFSLWALGLERWHSGDLEPALALEQQSLRLKRELDDHLGIGVCLEVMSWIAVSQGEGERAARLLGAADAVLQRVGMPFAGIQPMWPHHVAGEDRARRLVTESGFRQEYAIGAKLAMDDIVAFALGEATTSTDTGRGGTAVAAGSLTRREAGVAALVGRGLTNKEIAAQLVISVRTVEKHVDHILRKLGADNRAQVARWVSEHEE